MLIQFCRTAVVAAAALAAYNSVLNSMNITFCSLCNVLQPDDLALCAAQQREKREKRQQNTSGSEIWYMGPRIDMQYIVHSRFYWVEESPVLLHSEWGRGGSGNNVAAILLKTFVYIFIRRCSIALDSLIRRCFVCVFCVYLLRSMAMIAPIYPSKIMLCEWNIWTYLSFRIWLNDLIWIVCGHNIEL